jgi:hypothetical protein
MTDPLTSALAKIEQAIRLLDEALSEKTESPRADVRIALDELKSARDDLVGKSQQAGIAD